MSFLELLEPSLQLEVGLDELSAHHFGVPKLLELDAVIDVHVEILRRPLAYADVHVVGTS